MANKFVNWIKNALFVPEAVSRDPAQTAVKRVGFVAVTGSGGSSRTNFEQATFDFDTLTSAYDTDSYIHQAVDKYVDLIFKEGWQLTGKNQQSLDYIKLRLAVMAESTSTNTNTLLTEVADSVVKYGNSFLMKARIKESLNIPGLNVQGIAGLQPVGGYFSLMPSTVTIARDKNGTVLQYQQKVSGQNNTLKIKPTDMVHITWKKPIGKPYGMPFILPVLDDIRLLREIEDNVSNLLYKYLHPLYKFVIGLQKDGMEATAEEIDQVRQVVANMPMDGTLVLPERYDVEVVGAEGSALNAEWALRYFEQRVFTGLGVPETVFGRASTANKSTADNLTVEMHDKIKAFQRVIADEIHFQIIKELLMEGGYDILTTPDDDVQFEFNEIAIDERIKKENHAVSKYTQNAITLEEMRRDIGADPTVDESRLYFNVVTIPVAVQTAQAKSDASGTSSTPKTSTSKNKPSNQYGTKLSPKAKPSTTVKPAAKTAARYESLEFLNTKEYSSKMQTSFTALRSDMIEVASNPSNQDMIGIIVEAARTKNKEMAKEHISTAFNQGVLQCKKDCHVKRQAPNMSQFLRSVQSSTERDINRFYDSLKMLLDKAVKEQDDRTRKTLVANSFDSIQYRLDFMANTQLAKSYNLAYAAAAKAYGRKELDVISNEECCEVCAGKKTISLEVENLLLVIPPWHANDLCYIKVR
jgi:hypothetical protein